MKSVGVVTGTRADFGIFRPILRAIEKSPKLDLKLMVCGAHLSEKFGNTVEEITKGGFVISERLPNLEDDDSPAGITRSMAKGVELFAEAYVRSLPDVLLVLGDRYEMFAAAAASLPFNIPIAHIHGGELTEGLIDEVIRHSITKMSQFHFVSTEIHANRVIQMGELAANVYVSGAPSLDEITATELITSSDLSSEIGYGTDKPPVLVTYHPVTLEYTDTRSQIDSLIEALQGLENPIIFTYPNADTHSQIIIEAIEVFCEMSLNAIAIKSLGSRQNFSLMACAAAMVGNSSSGIIEAASFRLPVVNVGNRQRGRMRNANVIDVGYSANEIRQGVDQALSAKFAHSLKGLRNCYGDGSAAQKIIAVLECVDISPSVLKKPFQDITFVV